MLIAILVKVIARLLKISATVKVAQCEIVQSDSRRNLILISYFAVDPKSVSVRPRNI